MKTLQLLTQQFKQWWRICLALSSDQLLRSPQKPELSDQSSIEERIGQTSHSSRQTGLRMSLTKEKRSRLILIVAIGSLTGTMGHRFYNQPKLDVGTIAPYTIVAPEPITIADPKTTEANQKVAISQIIPVLAIDPAINQQIYQNFQEILAQGKRIRQQAGDLPFTNTAILSLATQIYLRRAQEWEWRTLLMILEDPQIDNQSLSKYFLSDLNSANELDFQRLNNSGQKALQELQAYHYLAASNEFSELLVTITQARQLYQQAIALISQSVASPNRDRSANFSLDTIYDSSVFDLSDAQWEEMSAGMEQALDRILSQGIPPGLPENILATAINKQVKISIPASTETLANKILLAIIKPNLIADKEESLKKAAQAAEAVKPVMLEVKQGQVIVAAGQMISHADFLLLDHFHLSRRGINWLGLIGYAFLISSGVGIFWLVKRRFQPHLRRRDCILLLLLSLSTPLLPSLGVPYLSLPAVGLLVGSFYSSALAISAIALLMIVLPVGMNIQGISLVASGVGGMLGGMLAGKLRSREELAILGGGVGLIQGCVYLVLTLILSVTVIPFWYNILTSAACQGLAGLAWSIVALGLSPYLERLFDLITPIRLAELANPNRPLLKQLAAQAPGTFQHTLFVATLAEAAAKELGCNVELVRAGILYHDIGKMHAPEYFIENQMGSPNKHDELNDPWKSAQIIKKHVTEGLVLARKHHLPTAIQAFIPEHQGTMLIAYFYYQAKQMVEKDPSLTLSEADFRYDRTNSPITGNRNCDFSRFL